LQDGKEVQDLHSLRQQVTSQHETFVAQDFSNKYVFRSALLILLFAH
jgi:hypothetical protein